MKRFFVLLSCIIAISLTTIGQSKNEAIEAYNKAIGLMTTDPAAAIKAFEESIRISSALGEEGREIKELSELTLPQLHYEVALSLFRERKIVEAIAGFEKAVQVSEKFNVQDIKSKSENVLHQLYSTRGNELFRGGDDAGALAFFDKSLALNPNFARAYLGKALVFRRQEKASEFKEAIDKAIETGLLINDERTVSTAESTARDFFYVRAVRAKDIKNYTEAINLIQSSLIYDSNFAESHYLLAVIYNLQKKWNLAIESASKGLEILKDAELSETAKYYFELGTAYAGAGNIASACKAFISASAYADFKESATHQVKHVLKCE